MRCDADWWQSHVVDRKRAFRDDAMRQAAARAVSSPECITKSKNHPRRECYYGPAPWPYEGELVKVTVEFPPLGKPGFVITCEKMVAATHGEHSIWRRP